MSKIDIFSIEKDLPYVLRTMLEKYESQENKMLMLLGSLTAISSILPNVSGIYGKDRIYPNLYTFICGPAASGKGKLKICRNLVSSIDNHLINEGKGILIPGNITYPGFITLFQDFGEQGLIFETEADVISGSFKKEHGNYSELLRQAFHHEPATSYRKGDNEFIRINEPKLSVLLSGTPDQLYPMFIDGKNGLFSRFLFFNIDHSIEWDNTVLSGESIVISDDIKPLQDHFYSLYTQLLHYPIEFHTQEADIHVFNTFFSTWTTWVEANCSVEIQATIKRSGLISYRIAMILSLLRGFEHHTLEAKLFCNSLDFNISLLLMSELIDHAIKDFNSIQKPGKTPSSIVEIFFENLPDAFDRPGYLGVAKNCSINHKTAERYIQKFVQSEKVNRIAQGSYQKAC
ncbi:MAG: DUF3987 domain-containing protein [Cyclobacteriaceae bacterium]